MPLWKKVIGAIGAVLATSPLWPYLKKVLEWGEHTEFLLHRAHDIRGVGPMLDAILNPPQWLPLLLLPFGLILLWLALRHGKSKPKTELVPAEVTGDIDARAAFFQILESSVWSRHQLETTTDTQHLVRNWLEVRLDREIHKALRNSKLSAWGEESLPGFATTPEKPIPPDTWDKVEIKFDRSHLPRSAAHFKGPTSLQLGPMAWVGVKFSRDQIFRLFPLATKAWPDFKKWDAKEKFELYEAACLWFNIDPVLPMPEQARSKYQTWKEMVFGGGLPIDVKNTLQIAQIDEKKESAVTPHDLIDRGVLETLAEHEGYLPLFLYPHKRGEK